MRPRNEVSIPRNKSFKICGRPLLVKTVNGGEVLGKPRGFGACGVTSASVYAGTGFPPTFELSQAAGSPLLPRGKGGSQLPQAPSSPCGGQFCGGGQQCQPRVIPPKFFLGCSC